MTGFLDLSLGVRLMIYHLVIPRHKIRLDDDRDLRSEIFSNICRVNRLLFSETNPLLYSQLEITVCPSRSALKFFRVIGPLNRDALRKIILVCKVRDLIRYECLDSILLGTKCPYPSRAARLFNTLTKCPNANLHITTEPEALAYLDGSTVYPAFATMHGYARATVSIDGSQDPARKICNHDHQQVGLAVTRMQQRFDQGMKSMISPCSSKCQIHNGPISTKATRMVHISVEPEKCPACSYEKFLAIYKESARSIFRAFED